MSKRKPRDIKTKSEMAVQEAIEIIERVGTALPRILVSLPQYMIMKAQVVEGIDEDIIRDLSSDDCIELATLLENEDEKIRDYFFNLNPKIKRCYEMKAFT